VVNELMAELIEEDGEYDVFVKCIFLMDYTSILYVRQYRMVRGTLHEDIY
jgi:hypothetical protein